MNLRLFPQSLNLQTIIRRHERVSKMRSQMQLCMLRAYEELLMLDMMVMTSLMRRQKRRREHVTSHTFQRKSQRSTIKTEAFHVPKPHYEHGLKCLSCFCCLNMNQQSRQVEHMCPAAVVGKLLTRIKARGSSL